MADYFAVAQRLLQEVAACAAAAGVDLPDRQYVAPGLAGTEAWDCEQVTVAALALNTGIASTGAAQTGGLAPISPAGVSVADLQLRVEIVRAVPVMEDDGNPPSVDDVTAAGKAAFADMAVLRAAAVAVQRAGGLTGGVRVSMLFGPVQPTGPAGGYAGTAWTFALDIV